MSSRIEVVKVGGSLLRRPDLVAQIKCCVSSFEGRVLLLFGGGEIIDAIRHIDAVHLLPAAETHWQCVTLLDTTFWLATQWFPQWQSISTADELDRWNSDDARIGIVRPGCFYNREHDFDVRQDWSTTTDTIAVCLAARINAATVTLLKSCELPSSDLQHLASLGIVDAALPTVATQFAIPVRCRTLHQTAA